MCQNDDEEGRICNQCYRSPTLATEKSNPACNQEGQDSPHPVASSQKVTPLVTSSDTGWQKRGTLKNYNSLSGVGHVFGTLSKQVLAYEVLQNQCVHVIGSVTTYFIPCIDEDKKQP